MIVENLNTLAPTPLPGGPLVERTAIQAFAGPVRFSTEDPAGNLDWARNTQRILSGDTIIIGSGKSVWLSAEADGLGTYVVSMGVG